MTERPLTTLRREEPDSPGRIGAGIESLCRWAAYGGGIVLAGMATMTVLSIVGRATGIGAIRGDYELVATGCALAVFAFLPWCQLRRGHVTVDVVAALLPPRAQAVLGLVGDLIVTLAALLILRQLWFGFGEKLPHLDQPLRDALGFGYAPFFAETTYELEIPVWMPYGIALALSCVFVAPCLYTVVRAWRWVRDGREGTA